MERGVSIDMKTQKRRGILIGFFVGFFIVIVGILLLWIFESSPQRNRRKDIYFFVHQGESVKAVAKNLKDAGLIHSELFFTTLARVSRKTSSIKAGEYKIRAGMNNTEILNMLSEGKVSTLKFTVPEGLHIKQIAKLLEGYGIVDAQEFIEACYNKDLLTRYSIPFHSAEGFLFPDTYVVAKGLNAQQIASIMIERFFENLEEISFFPENLEELKRVVTIASLVEREVKVDTERPLVAAVFYNRLKAGKRLESCATVQYVLGETKSRLLYNDLKIDSPYNTYIHKGLPPGPIANPGIKSISASIYPAEVDYLFFVSKRDGSHYFSETYQEHLKAIQKYSPSGGIAHQLS